MKIEHASNDMHLDLFMICCHCYAFNYSEDFCLFKAVCDIKIIDAVVSLCSIMGYNNYCILLQTFV